ncbi:hypothetical protein HYFRA_00010494, partial [Hymenoscyphus fraxineus]
MLNTFFRAALIASFAINSVVAISPLTIKGSKFFADGQQFFLKGVAYQGTPDDPLIDATQCQIDADLMKSIGTNSIRVYHINPFKNHDDCMKIFADAGIYLWLHLDTFNTSIVSDAPTWTPRQFTAFTEVLDVMHQYENVGGFWIGNEVVAKPTQANASPFIKAAAADIKAYIALKQYRTLPIGYSGADVAEVRKELQNYLACEPNPMDNIDFYGLNSYEWCGDSSFTVSGYSNLQKMSESYPIPIFFSETGCNLPAPRLFTDQGAIFGPEMSGTWSGSIVYEWVQEANNYGLVKYDNDKATGKPTPIEPGFTNLVNEWKKAVPVGVAEADYTPTFSHPECPPAASGWPIAGQVPIPKIDQAIIAAKAGAAPGTVPSPAPVSPANAPATTSKPNSNSPKSNGTKPITNPKGTGNGNGNGTLPLAPFMNGTATFTPKTPKAKATTMPTSILTASSPPGGVMPAPTPTGKAGGVNGSPGGGVAPNVGNGNGTPVLATQSAVSPTV